MKKINSYSPFQPYHWAYILISAIMLVSWVLNMDYVRYYLNGWNIGTWNTFTVSELMINYEGGFVRRGLLGEILFKISELTGYSPRVPILSICFISYIIVLWFFLKQFHRHKFIWWLIFTTFLCGMFENFIRKDYLMYTLVIAEIYIARDGIKTYCQAITITVISIFGLLLHEAYIFFGVPFVVLMMLRSDNWKGFLSLIFLIIGVFGVLSFFKGNEEYVRQIMNSWNEFFKEEYIKGAFYYETSITALAWTTEYAINFHWTMNTMIYTHPWVPGWLVFFLRILFYVLTYYYITNFLYVFRFKSDFGDLDRWNISALYLFSTVCLLPLFLFLSCDYGRIYQYAWITTFVIFLLVPRELISNIFGPKFISVSRTISDGINKIVRPNKLIMVLLLLFMAESMALCNPENAFEISPVGSIITWLGNL